jgi:hypothetical protein
MTDLSRSLFAADPAEVTDLLGALHAKTRLLHKRVMPPTGRTDTMFAISFVLTQFLRGDPATGPATPNSITLTGQLFDAKLA